MSSIWCKNSGPEEGAVGIYSTTNDLVKFVQGNLGLIDSDILSYMQYCQDTRFVPQMSCFMKKIMFPIMGVQFEQMGLGWMISKDPSEIFYDGGTGAFSSFVGINCKKKTGIVVLANKLSKSTHQLGMKFLRSL